ncbi:MAG: fumarate hydratase [Crocinitomicaceae bacterium]|nr:fumarate hydratase [Crocinitomicaceae bacterium]
MKASVISGDIIASTHLTLNDREIIEKSLRGYFRHLTENYNCYCRLIKGDYIEIIVPEPSQGLRIALALKAYIKSIKISKITLARRDRMVDLYKKHGIRVALGYGELTTINREKGIIDGEAIYLTGRRLSEQSTHGYHERIVVKETLFFDSNHQELNIHMQPIISLLDVLLYKATPKQSQVLHYKLMNNSEKDISKKLRVVQSVINQHSTSVGWNAIESTVEYYEWLLRNMKL